MTLPIRFGVIFRSLSPPWYLCPRELLWSRDDLLGNPDAPEEVARAVCPGDSRTVFAMKLSLKSLQRRPGYGQDAVLEHPEEPEARLVGRDEGTVDTQAALEEWSHYPG